MEKLRRGGNRHGVEKDERFTKVEENGLLYLKWFDISHTHTHTHTESLTPYSIDIQGSLLACFLSLAFSVIRISVRLLPTQK